MADLDRQLGVTARKMQNSKSLPDACETLKKSCPRIYRELSEINQHSPEIQLWGHCSNVDELAHQRIVDPQILAALFEIAKLPLNPKLLHAGLQHTYGYLLSTLETPYGFKRDRWIHSILDRNFGLPLRTLGPAPREGTLLRNATYFFGRISFSGQPREIRKLRQLKEHVSTALQQYPFRKLSVDRIVETLSLPKHRSRRISLLTDLVKFPEWVNDSKIHSELSALLIYSIRDSDAKYSQLITAFPVTSESTNELLQQENMGKHKSIRLRFNALIPNLKQNTFHGTRSLSGVSGSRRNQELSKYDFRDR